MGKTKSRESDKPPDILAKRVRTGARISGISEVSKLVNPVNTRINRQTTKKPAKVSEKEQATNNSSTNNTSSTEHVNKVPPIIITNKSYDELYSLLKQNNINEFKLSIISIGVRVHLNNLDTHKKLITDLQKSDTQFYTFDSQETKIVRVVVYGLPKISLDRIKDSLKENNAEPFDIKSMISNNDRNPNRGLYMLYYTKKSNQFENFKQQKAICHVIFKWRYYVKSPDAVPQCHKCLKFGHGSKNCHQPTKCLFCAEDHQTENCEKFKKGDTADNDLLNLMKCSNCLSNHPANYKECPSKAEYIKIKNSIANKKSQTPPKSNQTKNMEMKQFTRPIQTYEEKTFDSTAMDFESANENFTDNQSIMSEDEDNESILSSIANKNNNPVPHSSSQSNPTYASVVSSQRTQSKNNSSFLAPKQKFNKNLFSIKTKQKSDKEEDLFTSKELFVIFKKLCIKFSTCKTKIDQIAVLCEAASEYVYNLNDV